VSRSNRLSLSIAGTAAVALASLPLGITPASAAKVSEGTTSSISLVEAASKASRFNWNLQNGQSLAYMADQEGRGRGRGGRGNSGVVLTWLQQLLRDLGIVLPSQFADGGFGDVGMQ
jgi:hypothetical protein